MIRRRLFASRRGYRAALAAALVATSGAVATFYLVGWQPWA
jgi:hypothetical protein